MSASGRPSPSGHLLPKGRFKMISLLLGFPFTAVKDFIFPYEPQLALRFKIFQPNSFTFFS